MKHCANPFLFFSFFICESYFTPSRLFAIIISVYFELEFMYIEIKRCYYYCHLKRVIFR